MRFSSVQFSSVSQLCPTLWPHESQHARPPCPSPSPGVHSDSRPSSQWCHSAISSSIVPFSSCPQSLQASVSFPMSQLFTWGGQSTGVSALASFLPKIHLNFSCNSLMLSSLCVSSLIILFLCYQIHLPFLLHYLRSNLPLILASIFFVLYIVVFISGV